MAAQVYSFKPAGVSDEEYKSAQNDRRQQRLQKALEHADEGVKSIFEILRGELPEANAGDLVGVCAESGHERYDQVVIDVARTVFGRGLRPRHSMFSNARLFGYRVI